MSEAGLWAPEHRWLTAGLVLTVTFVASEALAVAPAAPVIARELHGLGLYGWVFSAFMLASLIGTIVAGRMADARGPATPYIGALVLFVCGLAVGGLAPTMPLLVLGRAVQGLGAGALPAVAYVSIGRTLPERLRPRMMAVLSTAWVVPGLFAPAVAAVVIHHVGWRWIFLGLIPLVAASGPVAIPALIRIAPAEAVASARRAIFDAVCVAGGAALVLGGLTAKLTWQRVPLVAVGLAVGLPALSRVLPPGALRARPGLPATVTTRLLLMFGFFGADAYVPLVIQTVRHAGLAATAVAVTGATLAWTAGSWVQVRVARSREGRSLIRAGAGLVLVSTVAFAAIVVADVPVLFGAAAWTVSGFGMGLAFAPITVLVLREAPAGQEGATSASLAVAETLGWALGTGVGGAAVAAAHNNGWGIGTGAGVALLAAALATAACLLVSRRLPGGKLITDADPPGAPPVSRVPTPPPAEGAPAGGR